MLQTKKFQKKMEEKELWTIIKPLIDQSNIGGIPGKEDMSIFIGLLDDRLSVEDRLAVMEELGCCKSRQCQLPHKAFYKKYADRTLKERISLMNEIDSPHKAPTILNDDGTLRVFWAFDEENHFTCVCSCQMIKGIKVTENSTVSSTYCACCGGHVKELWQTALGVRLKLKEVVSSVISTGGRKGCEFLFDII